MTHPSWDDSYADSTPAPWDIGRPQPVFARLAAAGLLRGPLLDAGCGTGENTLLAVTGGVEAPAGGVEALGVNISPRAIARATEKAAERGVAARFEVADALNLAELGLTFETVIDSGVFHVFSDDARPKYVASLAAVTRSDGHCYLMCFSDRQPGTEGPRRVRQDELRAAFRDGWTVISITAETFDINPGVFFPGTAAQAWLADLRRD